MMKHIQSILGAIIVAVMISGCVHQVDIPEATKVTVHDSKSMETRITTNPEIINELTDFLTADCKWKWKNPLSFEISFQDIVFWSGDTQIMTIQNDYEYLRFGKYRTRMTEEKWKSYSDITKKMRIEPQFLPEDNSMESNQNIEPMLKTPVD